MADQRSRANRLRSPLPQVFLHLVWGTRFRRPLLTPELRRPVYACIIKVCQELGADVLAIGGIEDHVHVLVKFPMNLAIGTFVGRMKGVSSHLVNHVLAPGGHFRWQGAYGAFSVSRRALGILKRYIAQQELHHRRGTIYPAAEQTHE
jgi:REP element-mobilizing transposase RayT